MKTFRLPDLGEGLRDAEIVAWHVGEGDRVIADQPLLAVETEKAVVEVPAPWSGRIAKIHGAPGDVIEIGAPLVEFDIDAEAEDKGAVVGELPGAGRPVGAAKQKEPHEKSGAVQRSIKTALAIRALALERGIDLATIKGTGPYGAITRADVAAAAEALDAEGYEPLRGVRRSMARNMAHAQAHVAATTITDEALVLHWAEGEDVTMRLVRALIAACKAEPALNAWYDGERQARRLHSDIHIGIAMNTKDGLFVPVLSDAGSRTEADLRAGLETMKRDVAARSVPPEALQGQTITLSNFGMLWGRYATLIIMPPQVAILGAGRITAEPRVCGGEIQACDVLPLSLTFDHRAVTGAEAAAFLKAVIEDLERKDHGIEQRRRQ